MRAKQVAVLPLKDGDDSGRLEPVDFFAGQRRIRPPCYFTSQVSPARSNLFKSPAPRFAITSLIC